MKTVPKKYPRACFDIDRTWPARNLSRCPDHVTMIDQTITDNIDKLEGLPPGLTSLCWRKAPTRGHRSPKTLVALDLPGVMVNVDQIFPPPLDPGNKVASGAAQIDLPPGLERLAGAILRVSTQRAAELLRLTRALPRTSMHFPKDSIDLIIEAWCPSFSIYACTCSISLYDVCMALLPPSLTDLSLYGNQPITARCFSSDPLPSLTMLRVDDKHISLEVMRGLVSMPLLVELEFLDDSGLTLPLLPLKTLAIRELAPGFADRIKISPTLGTLRLISPWENFPEKQKARRAAFGISLSSSTTVTVNYK